MQETGSIPELGRAHGEGNSNPLQYSCLGSPLVAYVHGVAKSRTQFSNEAPKFSLYIMSFCVLRNPFTSSAVHIYFWYKGYTNLEKIDWTCFLFFFSLECLILLIP